MAFANLLEEHEVERIRRAVLNYRSRHDVGDTTLAKAISTYLPVNVTFDSTIKNVQRLRKGERMRGAAFLNACVQFLEVEMATPPEEELGLALKNFIGLPFAPAGLWPNLEGDFLVRAADENRQARQAPLAVVAGAANVMQRLPELPLIVLTISKGEGLDYGVARERHFIKQDDEAEQEGGAFSEMNALDRKGICLPLGGQDLLVMMRDFLFSHMYILKQDAAGYSGRMIMPTVASFFDVGALPSAQQSHFDVALHRMPRK